MVVPDDRVSDLLVAVRKSIIDAAAVVATWSVWKQNILKHGSVS